MQKRLEKKTLTKKNVLDRESIRQKWTEQTQRKELGVFPQKAQQIE